MVKTYKKGFSVIMFDRCCFVHVQMYCDVNKPDCIRRYSNSIIAYLDTNKNEWIEL